MLLLLSSTPINTIKASAVPAITGNSTENQTFKNSKKRFKKRSKKRSKKRLRHLKNTTTKQQADFGTTFLIVLVIAWYPISIGLLITALILGITPLLIVSIVLLALPIAAALIFGLIFLIMLLTSTGDWC